MTQIEQQLVALAYEALRLQRQMKLLPSAERAKMMEAMPPDLENAIDQLIRIWDQMSTLLEESIELTSLAGQGDQR